MKKTIAILLMLISGQVFSQDFENLNVGRTAIDFNLKIIQGDKIIFSEINSNSPVVLIVLRGWVGYQCPVCSRQVGRFIAEAEKLKELGAAVLLVYPGPSAELQTKANEFTEDFNLPENFYFTLDPDYSMINKYGLRWDAPRETAYPSTFVVDKTGKIVYSKISKTHGGRAKADEVLEVLGKL
ncbi:MAG: redoxin domain-containing protein [Bacteroidetes bacterium]|nr:redoxin domain-containing protein [Bacteroidota bacterium]